MTDFSPAASIRDIDIQSIIYQNIFDRVFPAGSGLRTSLLGGADLNMNMVLSAIFTERPGIRLWTGV